MSQTLCQKIVDEVKCPVISVLTDETRDVNSTERLSNSARVITYSKGGQKRTAALKNCFLSELQENYSCKSVRDTLCLRNTMLW